MSVVEIYKWTYWYGLWMCVWWEIGRILIRNRGSNLGITRMSYMMLEQYMKEGKYAY